MKILSILSQQSAHRFRFPCPSPPEPLPGVFFSPKVFPFISLPVYNHKSGKLRTLRSLSKKRRNENSPENTTTKNFYLQQIENARLCHRPIRKSKELHFDWEKIDWGRRTLSGSEESTKRGFQMSPRDGTEKSYLRRKTGIQQRRKGVATFLIMIGSVSLNFWDLDTTATPFLLINLQVFNHRHCVLIISTWFFFFFSAGKLYISL